MITSNKYFCYLLEYHKLRISQGLGITDPTISEFSEYEMWEEISLVSLVLYADWEKDFIFCL